MKRILFFALAGALAIFVTSRNSALDAAQERVTICHVTGGDNTGHVIEVAARAVPAHLNHGDSVEAAEGLDVGDACEVVVVE